MKKIYDFLEDEIANLELDYRRDVKVNQARVRGSYQRCETKLDKLNKKVLELQRKLKAEYDDNLCELLNKTEYEIEEVEERKNKLKNLGHLLFKEGNECIRSFYDKFGYGIIDAMNSLK